MHYSLLLTSSSPAMFKQNRCSLIEFLVGPPAATSYFEPLSSHKLRVQVYFYHLDHLAKLRYLRGQDHGSDLVCLN